MATLSNEASCTRYRNVFKERVDDSTNPDLDISDAFEDIVIRLLTERLEVLENSLEIAIEISVVYFHFEFLVLD
jgi:hypothetical protein